MRLLIVFVLLALPEKLPEGASTMRSIKGRTNMAAAMAVLLQTVADRDLLYREKVIAKLKPQNRYEYWRAWTLYSVLLDRINEGVIQGPITAQSFQRFQSAGTVDITTLSATGTPLNIQTPRPIVAAHFMGSITTTETSATGVVEDAANRFFRQITLSDGGDPRFTLGDGSAGSSAFQMLESVARGWGETVPHLTEVADGGNTALVHTYTPIAVPTNRYGMDAVARSALRIGSIKTWNWRVTSGALADLRSTVGDTAVTAASCEIILEVDDSLGLEYPPNSFDLYSGFENLSLLTAGTSRRVALSTNGIVLFLGLQQRENSLRSRIILTNLALRVNGSQEVFDGTWDVVEWLMEKFGAAAANAPVGRAAIILDNRFNLQGIPAAGATGWDARLTNTAGTNAASDGLNIQSYYYIPRKSRDPNQR